MIPFFPQRYISHLLIVLMVVVACIGFLFSDFRSIFALRTGVFYAGEYMTFFTQVLLFQFLHGDIIHLLFNSYFLYMVWPEVEARMTKRQFLLFFLGSTVFVALGLVIFENPFSMTVGMSGFCMALLSYLWIDLRSVRSPAANQIMIFLAINIAIGFMPGISMIGHASGALFGILYWYGRRYIGR